MQVYVYHDGQQLGPLDETTVLSQLASGAFSHNDLGWVEGSTDWKPLHTLFPQASQPPSSRPPSLPPSQPPMRSSPPPLPALAASTMVGDALVCQVCRNGELVKKKKYRMSMPVVIIGYILLIPSILGVLAGCMLFFVTGNATTNTTTEIEDQVRVEMQDAGVPDDVINAVLSSKSIALETSGLTDTQRTAITDAQNSLAARSVGAGAAAFVAGGFAITLSIIAFVGGLLGWLLVMKKQVLECNYCGAVIAAS